MFSALDNALSQKAEDTLTEFSAVKKADIQLQTPLGNRQAQIGMNIMGAFAESQNSAFGWQVRAFGAENTTKGANAGIFFRRVDGETLYGINSFADYEDGDYGEFLRYGIGGELQNPFAAFAMNYYLPITDDKRRGATVAFSQKGYDANLRINIPQMDYLKLRGDYYYFGGAYGGEDDKGFRYGLEVQPISDLRIGVFYDDGGEEFGGDIVYVYNFGIPQKRESKVAFSPDLFSPVVREYSQRILITTTERIEVLRTSISVSVISVMTTRIVTEAMTTTTTMTMVGMTTTMFATRNTMTASRMATVSFTTTIPGRFNTLGGGDVEVTSGTKHFVTLPPIPQGPPYLLTITKDWFEIPGGGRYAYQPLSGGSSFDNSGQPAFALTITIAQGSEDFVSVAIMLMITTETTAADVITETEMIMVAMTTTTRLTTFATSTITIGAANVDSHLPSFPPSFPQMPKLALGKNTGNAIAMPPHYRLIRRKGFAIKPPPLIL